MPVPNDPEESRYAVDQPVLRTEDPILLRGHGRFADDLTLPRQVYAAMVSGNHAHGTIRHIDTEGARQSPGTSLILTGSDLRDYGALPCGMEMTSRDESPLRKPARPSLATEKVCFVSDPVACVIAETQAQARDAAEQVIVDIDPLPAITSARAAVARNAPQLYDDIPGNVALDFHFGDSNTVAEAVAGATDVVWLQIRNNRIVVAIMEPRTALDEYDPASGRYTMWLGCQGAFGMRNQIAGLLKVDREKVRVLTGNVGGSFGMTSFVYPEYVCLLHTARDLGRPVKWTDVRSTSFLSNQYGRDHEVNAALALDGEGRFLAVRLDIHANLGGYLAAIGPNMSTNNAVKNITSVYRTPLIEINTICAFTNTTPVSTYRGAGRPEANYYMERLVDTAARETGIDRVELQRRDHIRRDQIPYAAPSGQIYDSGDFPAVMQAGLKRADWDRSAVRKVQVRARSKLHGIGLATCLEVTMPVVTEMGGIRFDDDGGITIITGTLDYGQGYAAPFAQVLKSRLGLPFDKIRLLQGDSDALITGDGPSESKSIRASGGAIIEACDAVIDKTLQAASRVLDAAVDDIEFSGGRLTVAGTDRGIGLSELAARLRTDADIPAGIPDNLDVMLNHGGVPSTFPNGCHVCEVEIDPDTRKVDLVAYFMVNDFGVLVNLLLVEGQSHGGVVQGVSQVLLEHVVYDGKGQPLSESFMDYALPRASDILGLRFGSHPVPAITNALGAKGCGEAGCAGALPAGHECRR